MLQVSDLKGVVHIVQLVHKFHANALSFGKFPLVCGQFGQLKNRLSTLSTNRGASLRPQACYVSTKNRLSTLSTLSTPI